MNNAKDYNVDGLVGMIAGLCNLSHRSVMKYKVKIRNILQKQS